MHVVEFILPFYHDSLEIKGNTIEPIQIGLIDDESFKEGIPSNLSLTALVSHFLM
jgi:hypothetical protein